MFISFLYIATVKKRNEPKKRKPRRCLDRAIFDGYMFTTFANSTSPQRYLIVVSAECSNTLGDSADTHRRIKISTKLKSLCQTNIVKIIYAYNIHRAKHD